MSRFSVLTALARGHLLHASEPPTNIRNERADRRVRERSLFQLPGFGDSQTARSRVDCRNSRLTLSEGGVRISVPATGRRRLPRVTFQTWLCSCGLPYFAGLPRKRFDLLARTADIVEAAAGTELIREGESGASSLRSPKAKSRSRRAAGRSRPRRQEAYLTRPPRAFSS